MSRPIEVDYSGEGLLDAALARHIILAAGCIPRRDFISNRRIKGKASLDASLKGLNAGARFNPVLVLRDLDQDEDCGGSLVDALCKVRIQAPREKGLLLRVAVRTADAWLLADARSLSRSTGIPEAIIPSDPEALEAPKQRLIALLRRANLPLRRELGLIKSDEPADWPKIAGWLGQVFVPSKWQPQEAAEHAPSLARCLLRLRAL